MRNINVIRLLSGKVLNGLYAFSTGKEKMALDRQSVVSYCDFELTLQCRETLLFLRTLVSSGCAVLC